MITAILLVMLLGALISGVAVTVADASIITDWPDCCSGFDVVPCDKASCINSDPEFNRLTVW